MIFLTALSTRFIPTYVGHTPSTTSSHWEKPVHPHIRGAYRMISRVISTVFGSSPHTWGIRTNLHPKGCCLGSSPHTWGIHKVKLAVVDQRRFIPTYVGHTKAGYNRQRRIAVHPHIRGAYAHIGPSLCDISGSSPHTWGILYPSRLSSAAMRFIPTYVGHTWRIPCIMRRSSVHPHIRGAYSLQRL